MPYPWSPGNILTAVDLNDALADAGLGGYCIASTTSFSVPTGVGSFTAVTFATDVADPAAWHSTVSLTERFIPGIAGTSVYDVSANVTLTNNLAAGDRVAVAVLVNATGVNQCRTDIAAASASILVPTVPVNATVVLTSITDYISIGVLHSNGSARNVDARVHIKRIG